LRNLRSGHISYRAYEFEIFGIVATAVGDDMQVFDSFVRHHQAIFDIEIASVLGCAIDHLAHKSLIFRMYPLQYEFYRRLRSRVVFKNPQRFLGPENFPCRHDPAETAGVTQALGFCQIFPAPPEFLHQRFLFGDIYARAGETCEYSVFKEGHADPSYPSHSSLRVQDPILFVAAFTFLNHSLDHTSDAFAIVRVHNLQILRDRGYSTSRVPTENVKPLRRPVFAHSIGREGPTPDMRKPLPFGEVELAPLQLICFLSQSRFSAFLIVNIDTRTKPPEDIFLIIN
jgi:hypothetical protein